MDGKPTVSEFIENAPTENLLLKDEEWMYHHVRQGQYCLQIVKCGKEECCTSFRSFILKVLPNRFLPPSFPMAPDALIWQKNEKNAVYPTLTRALLM